MTKISQLPADNGPTSDDYVVVNDSTSGQTKKVLLSDFYSFILSSANTGSGITSGAIDWTNGDIWWQEIARATQAVAGDTLTASSIPARNYLQFIFKIIPTGGTVNAAITLNGDTSTNYSQAYLVYNSSAAVNSAILTSQASFPFDNGTPGNTNIIFGNAIAINFAAYEKHFILKTTWTGNTATNAPNVLDMQAKWANTSAQISSLTLTNAGTGDMAIGSEIIVLGHD